MTKKLNQSSDSDQTTPNIQRKTYTPEQKLKIVRESNRQNTAIEALRIKYSIAASVLHRWQDEFRTSQTAVAESTFGDKRNPKARAKQAGFEPGQSPDELKKIIGDQTVQIAILKMERPRHIATQFQRTY